MGDERVADWRMRFGSLLDLGATRSDHVLEVKDDENRASLRRQLRQIWQQRADVDGITVRVEGHDVGIATRATADREAGKAGDQAPGVDPGASDGATLPGLPGEYRLITFKCPDAGCKETLPASILAIFYDEREVPSCPTHGRAAWQL